MLIEPRAATAFASELWVIPHPAGTPYRVLERAPYSPTGGRVSWMRDGRHIVLNGGFRDRPGNHLFVVDVQRRTASPLTGGPAENASASASPIDDTIAFASGTDDYDLIQIPMDGSDAVTLLASSRDERWPTWSPTGQQIAYVTNARGGPEIWLRSIREAWTMPLVTRDSSELGEWQNLGRPTFSPDGQRMAYDVVGATHTIWVSPVSGGRAVPLDRDTSDQHSASWSPDGKSIAFQRLRDGKWELASMPLNGDTAIRLAEGNAGGGPQTAWSPTGEWIAHVRGGNLRVVSADGKTDKALGESGSPAFGFSNDGRLLHAVRRGPGAVWELATFDVTTGEQRSVARLSLPRSAAIAGFSVHPDGKSFALSLGVPRYDIWLLDGFRPRGEWFGGFRR